MNSNLAADKRHFLQQCRYTIVTQVKKNTDIVFASHEKVIEKGYSRQDLTYKIMIPKKERLDVLRTLYEYNIHDYSLFESEESLMNLLAFRDMRMNV